MKQNFINDVIQEIIPFRWKMFYNFQPQQYMSMNHILVQR